MLGAAAGLGRWFMGDAVFRFCGDFQRRRQRSATTAHRALPVCEVPALGMPWGTARSNAASAVCSRTGGACTGGCCRGAVQVVCEASSGFVTFLSPSVMQAVLGNHSAQSPASVSVASPGHAIGHCKVKYSLCRQFVAAVVGPALGAAGGLGRWFWGVAAGLWAGVFWGVQFCR